MLWFGFVFYEGDMGDFYIWLMVEVDYWFDSLDLVGVIFFIWLFSGLMFFEVGYSFIDDEFFINFIY